MVPRARARIPPGRLEDGDLFGKVFLGRYYVCHITDLNGAPLVPRPMMAWLRDRNFGIGHRKAGVGDDVARKFGAAVLLNTLADRET